MGSFAVEDDCPGGVSGADAEVGALVWVRRRNGSWWPGRILGMDELPENCVIPPRSAGTPIKLLGRPDGSIDWYNLEKSKRVKSFRCGEYDECIEKAKAMYKQQKRTHGETATGRYVRREDAIMHALEIERSRFPNKDDHEDDSEDDVCASQALCSTKSKNINGLSKRSRNAMGYGNEENSAQAMSQALIVYKQPQNTSSSSTRYASSKKKRKGKGQKDLKGDTVRGFQRMRDLREIETKDIPKQKFGAGIFSDGHQDVPLLESGPSFGYDLSNTNGIKKSKQSHSAIKKKRSNIGQSYENSRKKDRRRPLSKLCEDSEMTIPTYCHWNSAGQGQSSSQYRGDQMPDLLVPNRERNSFPTDVNNCSYSSGASSLETLLDTSHTNHAVPAMTTVKDAEASCTTGFANYNCSDGDEFDALTLEGDAMEEGNLNTYGSCMSIKDETTDGIKVGMSSVQHQRSSKKKSLNSVSLISKQSNKADKNVLLQQYDETIKLDGAICEATEHEGNMQFVMPEHDESSETISNHSNSEKGMASLPYYAPLQVIVPEQHPDLKPPIGHVMKPTKKAREDCRLYDVEVAVQGSYKGRHAPLVSLLSKWTGKPIMGYPVTVEVLEDSLPAVKSERHPAVGSLDSLLRSGAAEPRQARSSHKSRPKSGGRKKVSEQDLDKSWRPHTKKPASSPRKMRRLSSFAGSRRESAGRNNPVLTKTGGPTVACVPLRLVFSRINEALSFPVRQENPT